MIGVGIHVSMVMFLGACTLGVFALDNGQEGVVISTGNDCKNGTCVYEAAPQNKTVPPPPSPPPTRPKPDRGRPRPRDPYHREGRYWLVPPFLIGASSVIVVYIFMHCIYMHCYTKRKIRQITRRLPHNPTIILSDGDQLSQSSLSNMGMSGMPFSPGMAPITPIVRYDGSYGKTELLETQPFLICQHADMIAEDEQSPPKEPVRRKSSIMQHLQLPNMFRRPSRQRASVCSAGSVMESASSCSGGDGSVGDPPHMGRRRSTRASICFVPVGRTISDPSGTKSEWTPLQGFVYSSVLFARNASYSMACGAGADGQSQGLGNPNPFQGSNISNASSNSQSGGNLVASDPSATLDRSNDTATDVSQEGITIEVPPPRDTVVKFELADPTTDDSVFEEN